ncbi:hypothetical protein MEM_02909 [Candida albicans L26]|uniref:DUF2423 domain-containing protein n=3 Tax=Candida albicans TaxID=5476 RepID=Q5ANJ6_CANAL|nr:uncharacterized protein CAALFM_C304510WA [Candida albicans SC5314]KAF6072272.1 hypothetical protein FOB64_000322 [Candida albicans]KGQ92370.1 hypothetical protein MEU_02899 [Candida albicans P37005]KGR12833.1 hypothetical protein MG3_02921 [Candida albicans P78048]KGR17560.1 hypothetical protein MG9_02913 [Candida albicans P37037]KGT69881.1 hypothetical protein MEK_02922 [Candida albicans 12C]KGU10878.1 hypothetical protein MEY_02877 [Candida albicans 19F]KGU12139.1 hypothetical protein M|eukprot:XP_723119.1 hypothetical protein CAALFM_C304510WA [Candida albicans SC5314]
MAKSLRSKSKLQAKSTKRKGEFSKYVEERSKRIANRLAEETKKQEEAKKQQDPTQTQTEAMDIEDSKDKKVSTSGWRDSRSQVYKQRKLKNKNKKKTLKF